MRYVHQLLAIAALLSLTVEATAQPPLVLVTEKTKQYHRPSCPAVRGGKDVIAMTAAQAEARKFTSHPGCDPATGSDSPEEPATEGGASGEGRSAVFVYTAPGDKRYHREDCAKLPAKREKMLLEEAGKKWWPCSVCRPPIRKRPGARQQ